MYYSTVIPSMSSREKKSTIQLLVPSIQYRHILAHYQIPDSQWFSYLQPEKPYVLIEQPPDTSARLAWQLVKDQERGHAASATSPAHPPTNAWITGHDDS